MRTTNNMLINNMLYHINNNLYRMSKLQTQMATGKKIEIPSDDPIVAARALKFRTDVSEIKQFNSNASDAYSWMDMTEVTLGKMIDILHDARERAVQAANSGTLTMDDKNKIMQEIKQLRSQSLHLANTSYAGRYIFSGYMTDTKLMDEDGAYLCSVSSKDMMAIKTGLLPISAANPFVVDAGSNTFQISLKGKEADFIDVALPPAPATLPKTYTSIEDLAKDIQLAIDALEAVKPELKGVTVSAVNNRIEFALANTTAEDGTRQTIFLRQKETAGVLDPVLNRMNLRTEGYPGLAVSRPDDVNYQLGIGDLINVNVLGTELFGSGVKGQVPEYIAVFDEFIYSLQSSYHISNQGVLVNSSNPLDLTAAGSNVIDVTIGGTTHTVTLDAIVYDGATGKTLKDLALDIQVKINAAFGSNAVKVEEKGGRIAILSNTNDQISIQGADFLDKLNFEHTAGQISGISSNDGVNNAIANLQNMMDKVLSIRADVGARMNRVELTLNRLDSDNINFTKLMSDNEDMDMAEVIMRLKNEENVYRSSLGGGARIIQPSLIDFLR